MKGIGVSQGIVIEKVFKYEKVKIDVKKKVIKDTNKEITKFEKALKDASKEITELISKVNDEEKMIFEAHLLMINDPSLESDVKEHITKNKFNAEYSTKVITDNMIEIFKAMHDNEYMQERALDVLDIRDRILIKILNLKSSDLLNIKDDCIVIAYDLTPSDTAILNKKFVKGFVTEVGGRTSHTAIMARSLELPAIVGVKDLMKSIDMDQEIILDGSSGVIVLSPDEKTKVEYLKKAERLKEEKLSLLQFKDKKSISKDNVEVLIGANIGSPDDVELALKNGSEGVGLYRTEFLFMSKKNEPTEDEQFKAYKVVLEQMNPYPVVIRTLDIGGDKEVEYWDLEEELNPFLGNRAIRLCFSKKEMFKVQLKALLRASVYGNLKIMFPMICTLGELRDAKSILEECKCELTTDKVKFSENFEIGIMVETPAAAINSDVLIKEVDFFSIGTNDLIQYTMAADRMNENVSYLYQPYNPSILKLINLTIKSATSNGKWCGMCGEMAGEVEALPILFGMGLSEFSMSMNSVLQLRKKLTMYDKKECEKLVDDILKNTGTQEEVLELVRKFNKERGN